VVSKIFYFHPYLGKIPNLTNIFQRGWNRGVRGTPDREYRMNRFVCPILGEQILHGWRSVCLQSLTALHYEEKRMESYPESPRLLKIRVPNLGGSSIPYQKNSLWWKPIPFDGRLGLLGCICGICHLKGNCCWGWKRKIIIDFKRAGWDSGWDICYVPPPGSST